MLIFLALIIFTSNIVCYEIITHYKIFSNPKRSAFKDKIFEFSHYNTKFKVNIKEDFLLFTNDFNVFTYNNERPKEIPISFPIHYSGSTNKFDISLVFDQELLPKALFYSKKYSFYVEPAWNLIESIKNKSTLIAYNANERLLDESNLFKCSHSFNESQLQTSQFMPISNDCYGGLNGTTNHSESRIKRSVPDIRNRCTLLLIADWRFYRSIGNGNIRNTINYIVGVIGRMNVIFTRSKFRSKDKPNEIMTNYGFLIRQIIIHTQPTLPRQIKLRSAELESSPNFNFYSVLENVTLYAHEHKNDALQLFNSTNDEIVPSKDELRNVDNGLRRNIMIPHRPNGNGMYYDSTDHYNSYHHGNDKRWDSVGKLLESFSIHRPKLIVKKKRDELFHKSFESPQLFSSRTKLYSTGFVKKSDALPDVCLAHLFTHQPFRGNVLGLAYVASDRLYRPGGICTGPYTINYVQDNGDGNVKSIEKIIFLNTGLSSYQNEALRTVFTQEGDIITAHEFGHNWGSEHDTHSARQKIFQSLDTDVHKKDEIDNNQGPYLMHPFSLRGYDVNNRRFSPQSQLSIGTVLRNKAHLCFVKGPPSTTQIMSHATSDFHKDQGYTDTTSQVEGYCGNYILEKGEECDVGSNLNRNLILTLNEFGDTQTTYRLTDGNRTAILRPEFVPGDDCCEAETCRLKRYKGASCSDRNSLCCLGCKPASPAITCQPADLKFTFASRNLVKAIAPMNSNTAFAVHGNQFGSYNNLELLNATRKNQVLSNMVSVERPYKEVIDGSCYVVGRINCSGTWPECPSLNVTVDTILKSYSVAIVVRTTYKVSSSRSRIQTSVFNNQRIFKFLPRSTTCLSYDGKGYCDGLGQCLPLCEFYGQISCLCRKEEDSCKVCCKDAINNKCKPFTDSNNLQNISINLLLTEGEPCLNGYCDKKAQCRKEFTDQVQKIWNYIEDIDINNFRKLMKDNLVGTIVLLSAFCWIPISFFINSLDAKRDEELKRLQMKFLAKHGKRSQNTVVSRPINIEENHSDLRNQPTPSQIDFEDVTQYVYNPKREPFRQNFDFVERYPNHSPNFVSKV